MPHPPAAQLAGDVFCTAPSTPPMRHQLPAGTWLTCPASFPEIKKTGLLIFANVSTPIASASFSLRSALRLLEDKCLDARSDSPPAGERNWHLYSVAALVDPEFLNLELVYQQSSVSEITSISSNTKAGPLGSRNDEESDTSKLHRSIETSGGLWHPRRVVSLPFP